MDAYDQLQVIRDSGIESSETLKRKSRPKPHFIIDDLRSLIRSLKKYGLDTSLLETVEATAADGDAEDYIETALCDFHTSREQTFIRPYSKGEDVLLTVAANVYNRRNRAAEDYDAEIA